MNKKTIKALIGIACLILLIVVALVAWLLDGQSTPPVTGVTQSPTQAATTDTTDPIVTDPTQSTTETTEPIDTPAPPPENLPSSVEIPTEKDPQTGKVGISFPCQVPGYGLEIQKLDPYTGAFVEDGSNAQTQEVAMLLVENKGSYPVEYTQIQVQYGSDSLYFDITALPVGERLVVQERSGKAIPEGQAASAKALVVQRADMQMSEEQVQVTDNGDNTLTIRNLTDRTIPTVRVFYKYYMEDEGIYVGGIAFTVRITRLAAGSAVTVQPSHYTSQTSRVVMVLTYDS